MEQASHNLHLSGHQARVLFSRVRSRFRHNQPMVEIGYAFKRYCKKKLASIPEYNELGPKRQNQVLQAAMEQTFQEVKTEVSTRRAQDFLWANGYIRLHCSIAALICAASAIAGPFYYFKAMVRFSIPIVSGADYFFALSGGVMAGGLIGGVLSIFYLGLSGATDIMMERHFGNFFSNAGKTLGKLMREALDQELSKSGSP